MKISNNVESYIYLKPEEVVSNLLYLAKQSNDQIEVINKIVPTIKNKNFRK